MKNATLQRVCAGTVVNGLWSTKPLVKFVHTRLKTLDFSTTRTAFAAPGAVESWLLRLGAVFVSRRNNATSENVTVSERASVLSKRLCAR